MKNERRISNEEYNEILTKSLQSLIKIGYLNKELEESINGVPESLFKCIGQYTNDKIVKNRVNIFDLGILDLTFSKQIVTLYLLDYIYSEHKKCIEQYRKNKLGSDPRLRTFILIDEAHNFAPEDTDDPHEKMLGELIHTITAEGRKYGLHLILATQRPHKVKRGLLGECDNAIIMKMNSRQDLKLLADEMRILNVELLEPCLSFQGQGSAIAVGEMTRMAPYTHIFKSAPRRTKEGGVDIPFF